MRIYSPVALNKKWYVTLFYREVGEPLPVRIGRNLLSYGRGREHSGRLAHCQIEVTDEPYSIEIFPKGRLLGVVTALEPGIDERFKSTLSPADEVELARPGEIVVVDDLKLADEVIGNNDKIRQQLEVLKGKRRKFYG